jgi:hypothetical protein
MNFVESQDVGERVGFRDQDVAEPLGHALSLWARMNTEREAKEGRKVVCSAGE